MKTGLLLMLIMIVGQSFGQSTAESEVLALSKQKFSWMIAGDTDALSGLMADKGVLVHANGMVQSKDEYLNTLKSKRLVYKTIDAKGVTIRIIGETAIVLGQSDFTITFEGKQPPVFHFAYEEVYAKEGNKWKLAMYSVKPVNP